VAVPHAPAPPPAGAGRAGRRAQSTVEFSLVFGLFLVVLLGIVDSWIWTIESDAADVSVEQGVGVAMSALQSPTSLTPATGEVYLAILPLLKAPMLGTEVEDWSSSAWRSEIPPTRCPTADEVFEHEGVGHVIVCAVADGDGHVIVAVTGYALSLIPPGLGVLNWQGWGLPITESAAVNTGTYSP